MAIFLVIPTFPDYSALTLAIEEQQKLGSIKFLQLPRGEFFVSFKGTSQELSDLLAITPEGASGSAIVAAMGSYYGRAGTNIWEWVQAHGE